MQRLQPYLTTFQTLRKLMRAIFIGQNRQMLQVLYVSDKIFKKGQDLI